MKTILSPRVRLGPVVRYRNWWRARARHRGIRYWLADMGDVTRTSGVKPVNVEGLRADLDGIRNGYPFWTVEYVYSYGELEDGTLAKAFTDYLSRYLLREQSEAQNSQPVKQPDYYACGADRVRELCARNDR